MGARKLDIDHLLRRDREVFRRSDEGPDALFYLVPRFVQHIDEAALGAVTELYREYFPVSGTVLDLMSSWDSHLPPEAGYDHVVGVGMNAAELAANPRLDEYRVHDLNRRPVLPYADDTFDGCGCCVSVDYLTQPVEVLRDVGRVLRRGAPLVVTFSNRCFPTKAVAIWHALDDQGHLDFVAGLLDRTGAFAPAEAFDRTPAGGRDPLFAVIARAR